MTSVIASHAGTKADPATAAAAAAAAAEAVSLTQQLCWCHTERYA